MARRLLPVAVGALALLAMTACSDATNTNQPADPSSPQVQPSKVTDLPAGGQWLRDYGFSHGPDGFSLPSGLAIGERVDQANVVTLIVEAAQAAQLAEYLEANLVSMGFEIMARDLSLGTPSSLIFEATGWQGAFTLGEDKAAVTLRRGHGTFYSPS